MSDPRRNKKSDKGGRRGSAPLPSGPDEKIEKASLNGEDEEAKEAALDQIESLEKERDELLDKFQRLAAEFDNYRKRQARDFKRLIEQGRKKMTEELLTVLDNFDRARLTCQGDHSDKEVVDGIMQTSEQLQSIL